MPVSDNDDMPRTENEGGKDEEMARKMRDRDRLIEEQNDGKLEARRKKAERDSPYANTKILVYIAITTVFLSPKSFASWSEAGAIIEEERGDMKVKAETMAVDAHFFL